MLRGWRNKDACVKDECSEPSSEAEEWKLPELLPGFCSQKSPDRMKAGYAGGKIAWSMDIAQSFMNPAGAGYRLSTV